MADTKIEWADKSWNPVSGCTKVSQGCKNCYAERMFGRNLPEFKSQKFTDVLCHDDRLEQPLRWRQKKCEFCGGDAQAHTLGVMACKACGGTGTRPLRIFVNSMSDLFHADVPFEFIDRVFAVMALCPQHTFIVLTKRPERMLEYLSEHGRRQEIYGAATLLAKGDFSKFPPGMAHHRSSGDGWWPLPNVQLGVSVEDQPTADARIPLLLQTPASVRIVSYEPALGPVDFSHYLGINHEDAFAERGQTVVNPDRRIADALNREYGGLPMHDPWVRGIDQIICGGESGPGARPMHPDWARSVRDQCQAAGVAFFFKQWGEWADGSNFSSKARIVLNDGRVIQHCDDLPAEDRSRWNELRPRMMVPIGKHAAGRLLDGREWNEFPEVKRG